MVDNDSGLCRDQTAATGQLREEHSMSGYDNDTNGDGPAGLNVDGGAVKQPLKPKASGKGDLSSPSYDRNSMVCHCAAIGLALHVKARTYELTLSLLRAQRG